MSAPAEAPSGSLVATEGGPPVDELADVTITGPSSDWLADFARRLVSERLAACGNIVPQIRSIYAWEGAVEDDDEALLILHTRESLVARIIERTNQEHPDETPQVLALPVVNVNSPYRRWLLDSTLEPGD